ncbi:MAG: trypsin-like peptidase domain-containing protein [Geminicoccaceae bacterium]
MQAVGRLLVDGEGACTATAISPQKILTAAHCLGEPPRPEMAVFIMNSVDYGIDGIHRGGKVRAGGKAPLQTIRRDWAVLTLAPTAPSVGPHPSVPLSGLEEAKAAMQRQAPIKKAGFVFDPTGAASLGATADCRIRAIDPTGETFLFTCGQKGLGPGMSGSPLLVDGPEGEIVIGLQSAAVDLEGELFGVAVIPPPAAHAPIP